MGLASEVISVWRIRGGPRLLAGICTITAGRFEGWTVPVDELVGGDVVVHGFGAGFEGGDERFGHCKPAVVGHVVDPFRIAVIRVRGAKGADVVGFTIVIPGDDFDELGA